ncbi:MAG: zinc ribbon domain-containing protein [Chloroflexi bacterium]|nr:zinc ribbon domain-containing protein [Chloroflexota bacterium]
MGFLDSIKQGAGKVTFEADRMLRLNRVESAMGALKKNLEAQELDLGRAAFQLFKQNLLQIPALEGRFAQMVPLEKEIEEKRIEADRIRAEAAPQPVAPALYGHVCLNCKISLPIGAMFCPRCGGAATDVLPPAAAGRSCSRCSTAVSSDALFCPKCGSRVESEPSKAADSNAPAGGGESFRYATDGDTRLSPEPPALYCPTCRTQLPPDAIFCGSCGRPLSS